MKELKVCISFWFDGHLALPPAVNCDMAYATQEASGGVLWRRRPALGKTNSIQTRWYQIQ